MSRWILIAVVALVLGAVLLAACASRKQSSRAEGFVRAQVDAFERMIGGDDVQLVDVRTQQEFDAGHLAGAVLIDVKQDGFIDRAVGQLDAARPVAVYCRSGRRSADAAAQLAARGYRVTNLEGGILAWQQASKPVVKP